MSFFKLALLVLIIVALSLVGIAIGYINWVPDEQNPRSKASRQLTAAAIAIGTGTLVVIGMLLYSGFSGHLFVLACGLGSAILVYITARLQMR